MREIGSVADDLDVGAVPEGRFMHIAPIRDVHFGEARESAKNLLGPYGTLTPRIKQSVVVKCYSTILPLTTYQRNAVKFAFEPIIGYIKK